MKELKITFNQPMKYKEICEMFGEEEKKGTRSRTFQLKKWQNKYEIEKNKTFYTVIRELSPDEVKMVTNHGKYLTNFENFLILYLSNEAKNGKKSTILTNRNILELSSMVNPNYFKGKNAFYNYIEDFDFYINDKDLPQGKECYYKQGKILDESHIFFSASLRLLKRIVNDCLDSLAKQSLILKNKTFVCYKNTKTNKIWDSEVFECDDDMIQRILTVENNTLKEFNELMKEKYDDNTNTLKEINVNYYLKNEDRNELYKIRNYYFREEFKEEGFSAYSEAWELKLADRICFERELESRNFDWRAFNNLIIKKLETAKELSSISLNNDFILKFIKNTKELVDRKIYNTPEVYSK